MSKLASISIFTQTSCMEADGLATALYMMEMNDINTITVNLGNIKRCVSTDGYKESDLELDENSEQAIYNEHEDVNEYYRDNRAIVQDDILTAYFSKIDAYFTTIDNTFEDGIIFKIV